MASGSGCLSLFFADQFFKKLRSLDAVGDEQLFSPGLKDGFRKLEGVVSAVRFAFRDAEGSRQRNKGLAAGKSWYEISVLENYLCLVDNRVNELFCWVRETKRKKDRADVELLELRRKKFQLGMEEEREHLEALGRSVFDRFDNFLDRIKSGEEISIDSFGGESSYGKNKDEIIQSLIPPFLGIYDSHKELLKSIGRRLLFQNDDDDLDAVTINTLRNIFFFKYSTSYYFLMAEQVNIIFAERVINDLSTILMQRYALLPLELKYCFDYCSLFPRDYVIEVPLLVKLWMAQGFAVDEDVGRRYFEELLNRGFFQQLESDELETTKCRMDSHAFALSAITSGSRYLLSRPHAENYIPWPFHVSFDFHLNSHRQIPQDIIERDSLWIQSFLFPCQLKWKSDRGMIDPKKIRNIISPHHDSGRESVSNLLISKFNALRALELHDLGIQSLPDCMDQLKHLRYLDVSRNPDIKLLPNSITNLLNLQTLKLSSCSGLQELPKDMNNLTDLRHLEIEGCSNLRYMPPHLGHLTNLQTLSQFVLNDDVPSADDHKNCSELKELRRLNGLRGELEIKNLSSVLAKDGACKAAALGEKQNLQSLTLDWGVREGRSDQYQCQLEDLKPHRNLRGLSLIGYEGVDLPSWPLSGNHVQLVKLVLRRCHKLNVVPNVKLPSLKSLGLDNMVALEYLSIKYLEELFPSLQELCLKELPKLKGWWKDAVREKPSFRCLSKLIIQDCPKLVSMPLFPTVEELMLDSTSLKPFQQMLAMEKTQKSQASPPLSKSELPGNRRYVPLKTLRISNCDVGKSIPLDYFPKLERFDLSKCENFESFTFPEEPPLVLESLSWLRLMGLPKFVSFPEGGLAAPNLKEFYISNCKNLRSLPQQMHNLGSLEILIVEYCPDIESFPEGGLRAPNLKDFYIKECKKLRSLPQHMHNLVSLEILKVEDCPEIKCFPEGGLLAPNVKELYISNCKNLRSLPQQMHELGSLEILKVEYCPEIESFPEGGLLPPNLKEFYISNCENLRSLPQQMHNLGSLEILVVEYCPDIESFPEGGLRAPNLKDFYIKECKKLRSLPQHMHNLVSLEILKVEDCPEIKCFPEGGFPSNIKQLWIRECTKLTSLKCIGICKD